MQCEKYKIRQEGELKLLQLFGDLEIVKGA
jgi:hypothetical protein